MKKNARFFVIPIIAISLFVLILFGAAYSYFSANIITSNVTNINTSLPAKTTSIITTSNECALNILSSTMIQSKAGNVAANDSCYLNVTLNGAAGVKCTYDINLYTNYLNDVQNWDWSAFENPIGDSDYYDVYGFYGNPAMYGTFSSTMTNSSGSNRIDFLYLGVSGTQNSDEGTCINNIKNRRTDMYTLVAQNNQQNYFVGNEVPHYYSTSTTCMVGPSGSEYNSCNPTTNEICSTIARGTIQIAANDTAVTHSYTLLEEFVNTNTDQSPWANKSIKYVLKAENIVC